MSVRVTFRSLRRSKTFAAVTTGTIAFTIALATTVFAVVDGVLFKPLPYPESDRLFVAMGQDAGSRSGTASLAFGDLPYLSTVDSRISVAIAGGGRSYTTTDDPDVRIRTAGVGPNFLDVIGIRPFVGGFTREDFTAAPPAGTPQPALITYGLWQRRFGGDRTVTGRTFSAVGARFRVAGVLPRDFIYPFDRGSFAGIPDVLVPLIATPEDAANRWVRGVNVIVRIGRDLPLAIARERLNASMAAHVAEYPANPNRISPGPYVRVNLAPVARGLVRATRPLFLVALAAAALLVVLGALNVASLTAARILDRRHELVVRTALGSGQVRLTRLLLGETVVVGLTGAIAGLLLAAPLLRAVRRLLPEHLLTLKAVEVDWRVAAFATAAAIGPLVLLSLWPAWSTARTAIAATGFLTRPTSTARARAWGMHVMLTVQSAIGIALVVAGSLMLASYVMLKADDVGFQSQRLAVIQLWPGTNASAAERLRIEADAVRTMKLTPGIEDVALVDAPVLQQLYAGSAFAPPAGARPAFANDIPVTANFFGLAGLRLIAGRLPSIDEFTPPGSMAVVSENVARQYWITPERAVGQVLESPTRPAVTVAAVVGDAKLGDQAEVTGQFGEIYLPLDPGRPRLRMLMLRSVDDIDDALTHVRSTVKQRMPSVFLTRAETVETALARTSRLHLFRTIVFVSGACAGLLLLSVGIAGLVGTSVSGRLREIGIRSALGATPGNLVGMLVVHHLRPSMIGAVTGGLLSWWAMRSVATFLFKVDPHNFLLWFVSSAIVLLVAVVAAWIPARRAGRLAPMVVLRAE